MFKPMDVAKFNSNGYEAIFFISKGMPISDFQAILSRLIHFCEQKKIEAQNEEAQKIKDEEANKKPELEEAEEVEVFPISGKEDEKKEE